MPFEKRLPMVKRKEPFFKAGRHGPGNRWQEALHIFVDLSPEMFYLQPPRFYGVAVTLAVKEFNGCFLLNFQMRPNEALTRDFRVDTANLTTSSSL
jgi:hypothetical protein